MRTKSSIGQSAHLRYQSNPKLLKLRSTGYTNTELQSAGYTNTELQSAGYTNTKLKSAGYMQANKNKDIVTIHVKEITTFVKINLDLEMEKWRLQQSICIPLFIAKVAFVMYAHLCLLPCNLHQQCPIELPVPRKPRTAGMAWYHGGERHKGRESLAPDLHLQHMD